MVGLPLPPRSGAATAKADGHMLPTGELYVDLGGDYFRKRDPEPITKRLIAQLEALGHHVVLEELPEAA